MPGQEHLEGCSQVRLAVDVDEAVVLRNDAVDRGQPKAGAFAHDLRGEERFEQMRERVLVHAAPVIGQGEQRVVAGATSHVTDAVDLVERAVSRLDGDCADAGDGFPGVDAQVGQHLVHLRRVDADRP
jgi:hypothetical protein